MPQRPFLMIPKDLLADPKMSATAKLLFAQLCDHCNRESGKCNPRRSTLARELGICLRTVGYALRELRKAGWITLKRTRGGSHYQIEKGQRLPFEKGKDCSSRSANVAHLAPPDIITELDSYEGARKRAFSPPKKESMTEHILRLYYERKQRGV